MRPDPALRASLEATSRVVALVTARLGELAAGLPPADQSAVTDGIPDALIIRAFAVFATAALAGCLPPGQLARFLQDMGAAIVASTRENGESS